MLSQNNYDFRINKTFSRSVNAEPEDVFNLKAVMGGLGHYKTPKWGMTPYPDRDLFGAVETFQRKNKLKVDGVLKPGGPTERILDKILAKGFAAGEWDWMENTDPLGALKDNVKTKARPNKNALPSLLESYAPKGDTTNASDLEPNEKDARLALGPGAALYPLIIGGAKLAPKVLRELSRLFGAAQAAKKLDEAVKGKGSKTKTVPRTSIAPPLPPLPPTEPLKDKEKMPQKETYPANPPELPERLENIPPEIMPVKEVFPELDDELKNGGLIVESKGNAATKAELDRIRDHYLDKGWKHIAGGRDQDSGEEVKEFWIAGPGKAFPDEKGDGRKGGKRADLTFEKPDGTVVHIQSVDVDKNGKPTQREQENAYRIWKRSKRSHIIMHSKGAQLKSLKK